MSKTQVSVHGGSTSKISKVVVHPLVLLSAVDHFNRVAKANANKRVVGVLLGGIKSNVLDVSNCFAVPFDEDVSGREVWFLDHDYLENMFAMFKKVNVRERIIGWYHSGPRLYPNDIKINELFRKYNPNSVLVIIDVKLTDSADGIPTEAYVAIEEVHSDGTPNTKTFEHLPSEIGAEEAEEVGVEQLLRDIKDSSSGTLSQKIINQVMGLDGLHVQLQEIMSYLQLVTTKKVPVNNQIIFKLQDIFNLLPDVSLQTMVRATYMQTNDQMLVVYIGVIIRAVLALHDLINNKLKNRESEKEESASDSTANTKKDASAGDKKTDNKNSTTSPSNSEEKNAKDKKTSGEDKSGSAKKK